MTKVLGLDIGGANTKAAFIETNDGRIISVKTGSKHFPVWKRHKELHQMLLKLEKNVTASSKIDCVGVTMTAELADSYRTKREGVRDILNKVEKAFPAAEILVLDFNGNLLSLIKARTQALQVAAANWVATGWMVSKLIKNGLVLDIGSTTTSIVPIRDGKIAAEGTNDLEKLTNGELVYTGSLRTNVAAIVNCVPIKNRWTNVSSELFAQSGDIHLILGNISEEEYTVETADARGKTKAEAIARLARVVCADTEMLREEEILQIANYVYEKQVEQIAKSLAQVFSRNAKLKHTDMKIVVTGLGRKFLGRKAAHQIGFDSALDLEELTGHEIAKVSTAVGVALMVASKIEGRTIKWTQ